MFRLILFIILQFIWLPLSLAGVIWVGYRQIFTSRDLGASMTAIKVLNNRWLMDLFDLRTDKAARAIVKVLPNDSLYGIWLVIFPLWVVYKLTGGRVLYPDVPARGTEKVTDVILSRSFIFDEAINRHAADAEQLVILGAGFDTRAYGPLKDKGLSIFELDQENSQKLKIKAVQDAGLAHEHVHYIPVNFADENWIDGLKKSPYDPGRKTIFLWEGVSIYLSRADVCKTLTALKDNTAKGSVILADFYGDRFLKMLGSGLGMKLLALTDENFKLMFDFAQDYEARMRAFLDELGMGNAELAFLGTSSPKGPYMVVAEIPC